MDNDHLSLDVGSSCFIYSRSKQKWLEGTIAKIKVHSNTNQEWLTVKYGNNKSKKIQRFCKDLRLTAREPTIEANKKEAHVGWEELKSPPFDINTGTQYSNTVSINANELAFASEMSSDHPFGGIYIFSSIVNEWCVLRWYPKNLPFLKSTQLSLAFNPNTAELYIYGVHENALYSVLAKINIYTRKCKYNVIKSYNAGTGAAALIIDGKLHLIGGAVSNQHAIFNEDNQEFTKYQVWNSDAKHVMSGNRQHGMVHIPSQNMLWTLGGCNEGTSNDQIWGHDVSGTYYHLAPDAVWNQLLLRMPYKMSSFGCCVCYNGKYVIIFGGKREGRGKYGRYESVREIYVLDGECMGHNEGRIGSKNKCTLALPDKLSRELCTYNTVVLPYIPAYDADLIISGFLRKYVCPNYDGYISIDIVDLIFTLCQTEYIYLMQSDEMKPKHWRICVDDILNSIYETN